MQAKSGVPCFGLAANVDYTPPMEGWDGRTGSLKISGCVQNDVSEWMNSWKQILANYVITHAYV